MHTLHATVKQLNSVISIKEYKNITLFSSPNQVWGDEPCKDIIEQGRALVECRCVVDLYEFAINVLSAVITLKINNTLT